VEISRAALFGLGLGAVILTGGLIAIWQEDAPLSADQPDTELTWYQSSQFEKLVVGKKKPEVIALLGTPISAHSLIAPGTQAYDYSPAAKFLGSVSFRVVDDATGLAQRFVTIEFDELGIATGVRY
jgi:hypothetical protein